MFSTSPAEAFGSVAGARHTQEAKWCVPGILGVAGGWILSPEKSMRATSSLISAEKPGGRRRSGGGEPTVLDCVFSSSSRVFYAKKEALPSNSRFIRASDVKGLFVNLYPSRVRI
jgi:hypothetical protein